MIIRGKEYKLVPDKVKHRCTGCALKSICLELMDELEEGQNEEIDQCLRSPQIWEEVACL